MVFPRFPSEGGVKVGRGLRSAVALGSAFSARTLSLFDQLPAAALPSYLSGLVIGEELRAQAQLRKRDAVEALRYFGRDNPELQQVIESISRRVGDAELVLELHTLAQAVEDNAAILRHADLPKGAAEQLRALADELDTQLAKHRVRSDASTALALRNRAFWHLRELLEEIREAGRYVFRNDARALALFRSSAARTRARQRANKASKTQDSEPPGSSPNQTPSGWGSSGS